MIITLNSKLFLRGSNSSGVLRDWQEKANVSSIESLETELTALIDEKAPGNYGLGSSSGKSIDSIEALDATTENGWYLLAMSSEATIGSSSIKYANVLVVSHMDLYGYQILNPQGSIIRMIRYNVNGTWTDWEYMNPPNTLGVKYRTTERFNGKAVYTQTHDLGALPNTASKQIVFDDNVTHHVRHSIYAIGATNQVRELDRAEYTDDLYFKTGEKYYLQIRTTSDLSSLTGQVQIWYTLD